MESESPQRHLYFRLKIKLNTERLESIEDIKNKSHDISNSTDISRYQLDYLFLDLFYNLVEEFLFTNNIVFDDFDVSCFTSPDHDYLIRISYLRTSWDIIQKLRDMTCIFPSCSKEIYQNRLCSSHFQENKLNQFSEDDLLKYQTIHSDDDKKLYQEYVDEQELKDLYKKANLDIPLVINFPVYDNYNLFLPILDQSIQEKIKEYESQLENDDQETEAPIYLNFFLALESENLDVDKLLEIEFPESNDDDLSDSSDISIDDLSEVELDSEYIVEEEHNTHEDEKINDLLNNDLNSIEDLDTLEQSDNSSLDSDDDDSDINLEDDPDFLELKKEIKDSRL